MIHKTTGHVHVNKKSGTEAHTRACVHRDAAKAVNLPSNQKSRLNSKFKAVLNSTGAMLVYTVNESGFICVGF